MSNIITPAINCPKCGHNIDDHEYGNREHRWVCRKWSSCHCGLSPSGVARALLTAEPTEAGRKFNANPEK